MVWLSDDPIDEHNEAIVPKNLLAHPDELVWQGAGFDDFPKRAEDSSPIFSAVCWLLKSFDRQVLRNE